MIEKLVEQIEERFAELERQMSDPEVIADRERYAAVGREYRELEPAHELARAGASCAATSRAPQELLAEDGDDAELRRAGRRGAGAAARARGRDPPGDGRARPQRRQERDHRDPRRHRRRRGGAVRRRPVQDAHPLRRGARLRHRGALAVAGRGRRLQGGHVRDQAATAPTRCSSSRAAPTASSGCRRPSRRGGSTPRPRPWRCCPRRRRSRSQIDPERPADRRLSLLRARRPVGEHDRLRGPDHPRADRDRRLDAGREVAAAEPREGDAGAAGAPLRARARGAAGRDRRRAPLAGRHAASARRRSAPTTSRRAGSPTTASSSPRTTSTRSSAATSASSPTRSPPRRSARGSRRRPPRRRERVPAAAGTVARGAGGGDRRARGRRGREPAASTPSCCSRRRPERPRPARRRARGRGRRPGGREFGAMVRRRVRREPVAYILGRQRLSPHRAARRPRGS